MILVAELSIDRSMIKDKMLVRNKQLNSLLNRSDFLVRFFRCHTPILSKSFGNLAFWKLYSSNFEAVDSNYERLKKGLLENGFDFQDKTCLEHGPGNTYINAYNFLASGARDVILVDKYPRRKNKKRQKAFIDDEIAYICKKYNIDKAKFLELTSGKINFIAKDLREVNTAEIDLIYSNSVLEHVKDIEGNVKRMASILNKGGYMAHVIDMRDHYNFDNPFLFYKYPDEIWEKYLAKEGISYTNRLRYDDYRKLFVENGFSILSVDITKYPFFADSKLSEKFKKKNKDVLAIGVARFILKKI